MPQCGSYHDYCAISKLLPSSCSDCNLPRRIFILDLRCLTWLPLGLTSWILYPDTDEIVVFSKHYPNVTPRIRPATENRLYYHQVRTISMILDQYLLFLSQDLTRFIPFLDQFQPLAYRHDLLTVVAVLGTNLQQDCGAVELTVVLIFERPTIWPSQKLCRDLWLFGDSPFASLPSFYEDIVGSRSSMTLDDSHTAYPLDGFQYVVHLPFSSASTMLS